MRSLCIIWAADFMLDASAAGSACNIRHRLSAQKAMAGLVVIAVVAIERRQHCRYPPVICMSSSDLCLVRVKMSFSPLNDQKVKCSGRMALYEGDE